MTAASLFLLSATLFYSASARASSPGGSSEVPMTFEKLNLSMENTSTGVNQVHQRGIKYSEESSTDYCDKILPKCGSRCNYAAPDDDKAWNKCVDRCLPEECKK